MASNCQISSAFEDEGAVPIRTTTFPVTIHLTPPPGGYEIVGGDIATLSPLPVPPSVTDTRVTHVVREPGFDLIDAIMDPTGQSVLHFDG